MIMYLRRLVPIILPAPFLSAPFVLAQQIMADPHGADTADHGAAHARVPSWIDQAVFYEIFLRAFFPAGTLDGVTAKLDGLQKLGVNVLWLMPIHPIGKTHRLGTYGSMYSVSDYYAIDLGLGTKADLQHLVQAAHERHMRVLLDEVPNHTARDSVMMAPPAFYKQDASGKVVYPHSWTDVAALNYTDSALRQYMVDVFAYWPKTFDLDGFRCDDAGDVPVAFWDQVSAALRAIRPDVLLLAEASQPDLLRGAFNLDYAWPLLETMNQVIMHGRPASTIHEEVDRQQERFPSGTWHMLMSDDHDMRRAIVRFGSRGALAASALVFTLPGVPMLYNGMELGDTTPSAGPALFEKETIFWQSALTEPAFPEFYKVMIPLRKSSAALRNGELVWIRNSDENRVLTYLRRPSSPVALPSVSLASYGVRIFRSSR